MLRSVTNYSRNGVSDWILQRLSAVILALYSVFLLGYLVICPSVDYTTWSTLFGCTWMRIFSLLAVASVVVHGWIGLWTVSTDYIKCGKIRFLVLTAIGVVLFAYVVWAVQVLWGL